MTDADRIQELEAEHEHSWAVRLNNGDVYPPMTYELGCEFCDADPFAAVARAEKAEAELAAARREIERCNCGTWWHQSFGSATHRPDCPQHVAFYRTRLESAEEERDRLRGLVREARDHVKRWGWHRLSTIWHDWVPRADALIAEAEDAGGRE